MMISAVRTIALTLALALAGPVAYAQSGPRPLLVEGRKTVYQRVLTRPDAPRYAETNGAPVAVYPAFQPL